MIKFIDVLLSFAANYAPTYKTTDFIMRHRYNWLTKHRKWCKFCKGWRPLSHED